MQVKNSVQKVAFWLAVSVLISGGLFGSFNSANKLFTQGHMADVGSEFLQSDANYVKRERPPKTVLLLGAIDTRHNYLLPIQAAAQLIKRNFDGGEQQARQLEFRKFFSIKRCRKRQLICIGMSMVRRAS